MIPKQYVVPPSNDSVHELFLNDWRHKYIATFESLANVMENDHWWVSELQLQHAKASPDQKEIYIKIYGDIAGEGMYNQ